MIVHAYLDVDPAIIHRLLNERLDDFGQFARFVNEYLAARREEK